MFRRLPDLREAPVRITVDGRPVAAQAGATVAAGMNACRTTALSGTPRGPYCMMGACFECLVTVDGVGNRQGCLTAVREGMAVETQKGAREIARELQRGGAP